MATCVDLAEARIRRSGTASASRRCRSQSASGVRRQRADAFAADLLGARRHRAIREGKWKLVAKEDQPWELYDMEADRTEMHDLAAEMPER